MSEIFLCKPCKIAREAAGTSDQLPQVASRPDDHEADGES